MHNAIVASGERMKYLIAALIVATATLESATANACDQRAGAKVTTTMNQQLATLVGFTMVACTPAADAGKCSILCITTSLESDDNVKLLLVTITASAAVNMRPVGVSKFSRVSFADKNLLQRRRYLSISAARADQLQADFSKKALSPIQLMNLVRPEYAEGVIPERK